MLTGINYITHSDSAVIMLHEIYGINLHIANQCKQYHILGYDVYCPNMLKTQEPFSYMQGKKAYKHFIEYVGFDLDKNINELAQRIREQYKYIFLIGFSVGATLAWKCSKSGLYNGAICYYGSRIRNYLYLTPTCPTLLLFARHESSFSPESFLPKLSNTFNVCIKILEADHGFCDSFSPNYNELAAKNAEELAQNFLLNVQGKFCGYIF